MEFKVFIQKGELYYFLSGKEYILEHKFEKEEYKFKCWCESCCIGKVYVYVEVYWKRDRIYFSNEQDALLFKLTWM